MICRLLIGLGCLAAIGIALATVFGSANGIRVDTDPIKVNSDFTEEKLALDFWHCLPSSNVAVVHYNIVGKPFWNSGQTTVMNEDGNLLTCDKLRKIGHMQLLKLVEERNGSITTSN